MTLKLHLLVPFVKKYWLELIITLGLLWFGLALKWANIGWKSGDYVNFLKPWLQQIVDNGGFASLSMRIGDYTPPYVYLLTIISYFPTPESSDPYLAGIKLISIGFDVLLAFAVFLNAKRYLKTAHPFWPILIALIVFFLPTVILNGAVWGQVDASYTAFILISLYYLQEEKPLSAAIWFGVAFSFKLQAIFFLPVFIIYFWFKYRKKIAYVFAVPLVYYFLALPAIIMGRSIADITNIYFYQSDLYKALTLNMPNLYQWFPNGRYEELSGFAFGLFAVLMTLMFLVLVMEKIQLKSDHVLLLALWSVLMANFFLPAMHERYLYAGDVIVVLVAWQYRDKLYLVLLVQLISLFAYTPFLFGIEPIKHRDVALVFLATLAWTSYWLWRTISQPNKTIILNDRKGD
jgi:Gpi18-like mannosyltransferase